MAGLNESELLKRITFDPEIFGGKPIVRGRRLAVEHVVRMLAAGDTPESLIEEYDWLEKEDVLACLAYAAKNLRNETLHLVHPVAS